MLYPRQTAAEAARQHHNQQVAAHDTAQRQAHYLANPDYDPKLLKPVAIQPPPPMSDAERARLHSELLSHHREMANIERAITHLENQLAA